MGKFDKHVARAAAAMPAGGEQVGGLRGALRGAVHGRGMPVDYVHTGGGALGGRSLLMLAAERGRADCVAVLLDEFSAGAGAAADGASSGQEALRLARAGGHDAAARLLRRWAPGGAAGADDGSASDGEIPERGGRGGGGPGGEELSDGEVADAEDSDEGEIRSAPRQPQAAARPSVFARLKLGGGATSGAAASPREAASGAAAAAAPAPRWKKDYSELSFAEKLRQLKAPDAAAGGEDAADVEAPPEEGWVRFAAVHSQWRDGLEVRSDGSFSRVGRDDGGTWAPMEWEGESGTLRINWANWDVEDTLQTSDGGASWQAKGTNQCEYSNGLRQPSRRASDRDLRPLAGGDEYNFSLKLVAASDDGGRSMVVLPRWFNPVRADSLSPPWLCPSRCGC